MKRLVPTLAILGFLGLQGWGLERGFFERAHGFTWAMFRGMSGHQFYLEAIAITDGGEVPIPLAEAFPYHAHQAEFEAFDFAPLSKRTELQEDVAHWLGHWMRRRGVPATHVVLRWRIHNLATGAITRSPILEADLDAPPIR